MRDAHLRPYQVIDRSPDDDKTRLIDLWDEDTTWIRDSPDGRPLAHWDLVAARVMRGADGNLVIDGAPYLYPASARHALVRALHRAFAQSGHPSKAASSLADDREDFELSEDEADEGLAEGYLVCVGPIESSVEYGWMAEFAESVRDARLQELLDVALRGRGAFRRFKDVLSSFPSDRERWFRFHDERGREAMREWLDDNDIEPTTEPPERPG